MDLQSETGRKYVTYVSLACSVLSLVAGGAMGGIHGFSLALVVMVLGSVIITFAAPSFIMRS